MLSDTLLAANLRAAAGTAGAPPAVQRPDPARHRLSRDGDRLLVDTRAADGRWEPVAPASSQATAAVQALGAAAGRTVLLVGSGLGEALEAAAAAGVQGPVIALEPDPALAMLMLARRDWTSWFDSGLTLLVGPGYAGATACARRLDLTREPLTITVPAGSGRTEGLVEARGVADRIVREARANLEARRRFAGRYLLQTLGNLEVITSEGDAAALTGAFTGTPAIIVGAGPSLDDQLTTLATVADRAVIIASDTTLRPLARAGIAPPLTVAVDPGDANARHLTGLDQLAATWLVGEGSLDPRCFERFRGRTFSFEVSGHEPWPWLAGHGLRRGRLRAWGSVVTSAMDLALVMGCDPIVFVGTDLAFTGGRTYCRHTAHEAVWGAWIDAGHTWDEVWAALVAQWTEAREPDISGVPVRTAPHLLAFRNWIAEQAATLAPGRIVNATGAGILHGRGVTQARLDDTLAGMPAIDGLAVQQVLRAAHASRPTVTLTGAVDAALAECGSDATPLLDRWNAFAAGSLDRQQLRDSLERAAAQLAGGKVPVGSRTP